jgi:1,4-dihydroxy-2-naphthoate octaprenyltransferase
MSNINKNQEPDVSVSSNPTGNVDAPGHLSRWNTIINTCNFPSELKEPDLISKWLVIVRACVFSMTLTSGLIGGFLAMWAAHLAGRDIFSLNWVNFILATIAIVLAHAVNNMLNDYFDFKTGLDDSEYARAIYAPHPIIAGLTTEKGLLSVVALFNVIFISISLYFTWSMNNFDVLIFAISGLFLSIAYVSPPFYFKKRGLGEASVFIVWGPLMIGIVFLVTFGQIESWVWWATVPYAITVTTVIMGKHIDKYPLDIQKGIHTLPVIIGEKSARYLNQILMILFYVLIVGMVYTSMIGIGVLLVFLALPRLFKTLYLHNKPKPLSPPENWSVWPLWLVGWSFWHNKLAGGLFVLGLILNLILPTELVLINQIFP